MAGDWIKVEKTTPEKPEIDQIADRLALNPHDVLGKCFVVWCWFDDHTDDGFADGVKPAKIDRLTGMHGFADALAAVGWLTIIESGLSLPNFDRHNGSTAKQRALTNRRVAKTRKGCNAPSVTKALPEKRRKEKKRAASAAAAAGLRLVECDRDEAQTARRQIAHPQTLRQDRRTAA